MSCLNMIAKKNLIQVKNTLQQFIIMFAYNKNWGKLCYLLFSMINWYLSMVNLYYKTKKKGTVYTDFKSYCCASTVEILQCSLLCFISLGGSIAGNISKKSKEQLSVLKHFIVRQFRQTEFSQTTDLHSKEGLVRWLNYRLQTLFMGK